MRQTNNELEPEENAIIALLHIGFRILGKGANEAKWVNAL